jgi:hypothetical protein
MFPGEVLTSESVQSVAIFVGSRASDYAVELALPSMAVRHLKTHFSEARYMFVFSSVQPMCGISVELEFFEQSRGRDREQLRSPPTQKSQVQWH